MKKKTQQISSAVAMQRFGATVAKQIIAEKPGAHAKVVALVGDLGAGKTTFAQGFLKELGVKRRIISPTFLLIRPYQLRSVHHTQAFHIDCYRLHKSEELLTLGLQDILKNPENIVLIEWPELVEKYLPKNIHRIYIEHPTKGNSRSVIM